METLIEANQGAVRSSPLRLVLHGSVWFGAAVAANRLLPGILTVILACWLDPKQLGAISFVLAYYTILLPIADWSVSYALQKLIPEQKALAKQISWTAMFMRLGFSVVLGIVCWVLDVKTGVFHGWGLYLALLLVSSTFGTIVYIQNALRNFARGSLYAVGIHIVWVGSALALVRMGLPISGPLLGMVISFTVLGIFAFALDPYVRGRIAFLPHIAVEIVGFGFWATIAVALSGFVGQMGILVVDYINGDAAAGVFKVAATFGLVPALLGMIVVFPLMPVAREGLLNGQDISGGLVLPILRYLLMLGLPIAAAGCVLAPSVIGTFTQRSFAGAVWPLRILLAANLLQTLMTAVSGILFVGDGLRALTKIYGVMAAISLIVGVLLARRWGIIGMAGAYLLSWIAGALLMCRWFRRKCPVSLEWTVYLRHSISAIVMSAVVYFGIRIVQPPVAQLLLGACIAGVLYVLLLWLQRDSVLLHAVKVLRNWAIG
jgi:O-antigen/teichoic acid export membrane protein